MESKINKGGYVALLGEGIESASRLMQLESLAVNTNEADLNTHVTLLHLPHFSVMDNLGFQFDAELAAFLGYSLQDTADKALEILAAIEEGHLNSQRLASIFGDKGPSRCKTSDGYNYSWLVNHLGSPGYPDIVKAELQTMSRLGVASVGQLDTAIQPVQADSFFEFFKVV